MTKFFLKNKKDNFFASTIINITFLIISFFLLVPSYSGLKVFSKGEFAYIESLGFIFVGLSIYLFITFYLEKKFAFNTIKNKLLKIFVFLSLIGVSAIFLLIIISFIWIRFDVKVKCIDAKREYGGNCVNALINLLDDEKQSIRSKNSAIYVLGQLADKRALIILQKLYTGDIPEKESLYKTISQYELKKAINWCNEGNITSWMYGGL